MSNDAEFSFTLEGREIVTLKDGVTTVAQDATRDELMTAIHYLVGCVIREMDKNKGLKNYEQPT